jgi:hypothetical protein
MDGELSARATRPVSRPDSCTGQQRERIVKSLTISLEIIKNIRFGKRGEAVIAAIDEFGGPIYVKVNCLDIPKITGLLLGCAAINSRTSQSAPRREAIIPNSPLPVLHWQMGKPALDGESILILTLAGGATLAFQFPPQAAQRCGKALEQAGTVTEYPRKVSSS